MKTARTVWGIDLGRSALKALKLRDEGESLRVEAMAVIEHGRPLRGGPEDEQALDAALRRLSADHDLRGSHVAAAVGGSAAACRFIHLPPMDESMLPEVARFEAGQQFPWPLKEVIWRWQTFGDLDAPGAMDVDLGLFAVRSGAVGRTLLRWAEAGIRIDVIQAAPLALCNFLAFDGQLAADGITVLADVGTDHADLAAFDGRMAWMGAIPVGGNRLTEALAAARGIPFDQAERLKRGAAGQPGAGDALAAGPALAALDELIAAARKCLDELARLRGESRPARLLSVGNGLLLAGAENRLAEALGLPLVRLGGFNRLVPSAELDAAAFRAAVPSLAVAYGLAAQALGRTPIHANFLPEGTAHRRSWELRKPGRLVNWLRRNLPSLFGSDGGAGTT